VSSCESTIDSTFSSNALAKVRSAHRSEQFELLVGFLTFIRAAHYNTQSFRFGIAFCKDLGEFGPQQENLGRVINPEKEDDQRAGGPVA
jgi:hypothetical protein